MKTIRDILLGLVLGATCVLGGTWIYDHYRDLRDKAEADDRMREQRRQNHRDSLFRIRHEQDLHEQEQSRQERQERVAVHFLTEFYQQIILTEGTPSDTCQRFLTTACRQKLSDACATDHPGGQRLAWWLFRTDAQEPDMESLRRQLRISPEDDGWYRVHLVQQGVTEFRHVKLLFSDDRLLIDDVR